MKIKRITKGKKKILVLKIIKYNIKKIKYKKIIKI